MFEDDNEPAGIFKVVINDEEQYSLWLSLRRHMARSGA